MNKRMMRSLARKSRNTAKTSAGSLPSANINRQLTLQPRVHAVHATALHTLHADYKEQLMSENNLIVIRKVERIHDKATNKYLEVIEFPTSVSTSAKIKLLPAIVSDPALLEKELRNAGAILPKEEEKLKQLLTDVGKSDAPRDRAYAEHTGWTENGKTFVLVDGAIGENADQIIGVNRAYSVSDLR
jgi:Domain of unknown function (DUF927)